MGCGAEIDLGNLFADLEGWIEALDRELFDRF
jgi:hypothetical protein